MSWSKLGIPWECNGDIHGYSTMDTAILIVILRDGRQLLQHDGKSKVAWHTMGNGATSKDSKALVFHSVVFCSPHKPGYPNPDNLRQALSSMPWSLLFFTEVGKQ